MSPAMQYNIHISFSFWFKFPWALLKTDGFLGRTKQFPGNLCLKLCTILFYNWLILNLSGSSREEMLLQTIVDMSDMLLQIPSNAAELAERDDMMVKMIIEDLKMLLEKSEEVC